MGGKRPDQHNIDPGEANATDYKNRRQEEFIPDHKETLVNSMKDSIEGDNLIPKGGKNPVLAELQARKDRDESIARGEHLREGGIRGGAHAASGAQGGETARGGKAGADADERSSGGSDERQPLNASRDESRRAPDAERTE